jgi:hypothetical protein
MAAQKVAPNAVEKFRGGTTHGGLQDQWFDRWARNQGISTADLCAAVKQMAAGLIDADLGGGLVKTGRPARR